MDDEFDLLAGHDLGDSAAINQTQKETPDSEILVWHKMETEGFQPSAREGHSAVTNGLTIVIFGGIQTSVRTNSVLSLNVATGSWQMMNCVGDNPPARTQHAACAVNNFMFVHGGEGHCENSQVKFQLNNCDNKPKIDGVCPGDSLGGRAKVGINVIKGADVSQNEMSSSRIVCLDDFYVLDTDTREWYRIATTLSPLPRKGHSMVVVPIDGVPHIAIFGGYSMDSTTLSNSVHVCEVSKLLDYINSNRPKDPNVPAVLPEGKRPERRPLNETIVFRTLSCIGTPPPPRYRHSCTVVEDLRRGEHSMVIVGGIGKDQNIALSDVYALNLVSMKWTALSGGSGGHEVLRGIGAVGDGPANGIYGHTAFSVQKTSSGMTHDDEWNTELLLYGGSANASSGKGGYYKCIYAFDMGQCTWRTVSTGFAFPSARNNHSATVVPGWAPGNEIPHTTTAAGSNRSVTKINERQLTTSRQSASAVVIFGGVNSIMCASDTWALDLQWRPAGVEQYDSNAVQLVENELIEQINTHPPSSNIELQYMHSTGLLSANRMHANSYTNLPQLAHSTSSIRIHNDEKYLNTTTLSSTAFRPSSERHRRTEESAPRYPQSLSNQREDEQYSMRASASEPQFTLQQEDRPQQHTFRDSNTKYNFDGAAANSRKLLSKSFDVTATAGRGGGGDMIECMHTTMSPSMTQNKEEGVGHAFLKVRKERAQSDLQLKRERDRACQAEAESSMLQEQLLGAEASFAEERTRYENEVSALKEQLERSLQREKDLQVLNSEAHKLLVLFGIEQSKTTI